MRPMPLRARYRAGEKQFFHLRLALGGMFGMAPVASTWRRIASVSYPFVGMQDVARWQPFEELRFSRAIRPSPDTVHDDESQADAEAQHYAEHSEDRNKSFVMRVRFVRFVKAQEGRPA